MENQKSSDFFSACTLSRFLSLQMAMRAAIKLKVFDILSKPGPESKFSAAEIVSQMVTADPAAAATALERILRMLAVNNILTTSLRPSPSDTDTGGDDPKRVRVYGLTSDSRYLATRASRSLTDMFLFLSEKDTVKLFYTLEDAVLQPAAYARASTSVFEHFSKNQELSRLFNGTMAVTSKAFLDEILPLYRGFNDVTEVLDVGGGTGTTLRKIISVHPHIRGINFDLPHVIVDAPNISGVKHVAGDMFESLPNAQTIVLKWILHDWDDERCKTLLRNCRKALPENGKVVVMEFAIPEVLESNVESQNIISVDFQMIALSPGGKERTVAEFVALAMASGFAGANVFPINRGIHVLEFLKND